ncbi:hypothetical protein C7974DRAFT_59915 [Boeremia exigua]|uniref:uncharacterized protein n=1 Tax=Boeremia exigua TaxID=749465 RepID=UPI001E8E8D20|nr:uncharacterized protein C7974DRAFT_59915 [Boeremia exigua]KAH6615136.1 hypothetical protein C7974DRAFT_59915 [Boeremia exigua]
MQQKLKSVFRRSSKSRSHSGKHEQLDSSTRPSKASPPRGDHHHVSNGNRTSVDSSATGSVYTGRSRPVSSIYDDAHRAPTADDLISSTDPAIANDYKAYLPVLSPVNDQHGDEYITNGGDRHTTGRSEVRHEEDVADRNIARYSTSSDGGHRASNLASGPQHSRKTSLGAGSVGSALSPVQSTGVRQYPVGQDITRGDGVHDGVRPHTETTYDTSSRKRLSFPRTTAQVNPEMEIRKLRISDSDNSAVQSRRDTYEVRDSQSGVRHATVDGTEDGEETALARKLREDGVADLRNTVDTDGNITWAPAVTHEVIKPHKHEIIQHKIYREIHNYEHFHRIQPVMMTEVLPPRHWIPNPDGEGLIEISADELPARTGENRWWSICEHESPYSRLSTLPKYRTEPEIIEAGVFMTEAGYERKETIIIHPPTLADLTAYAGPVQAMHFDHKTGKSWMGELTTMDELRRLQRELDRAPDTRAFEMDGLNKSLPSLPLEGARRGSTSMPARKPVHGHPAAMHGVGTRREMAAA